MDANYNLYYHWRGRDRKIKEFDDIGTHIFSDGTILVGGGHDIVISRRGDILETYDITLNNYMITPSDNILVINKEKYLILIRRREETVKKINLDITGITDFTLSIPFRQQRHIMKAILMVMYPTLFFMIDRIYQYIPIL